MLVYSVVATGIVAHPCIDFSQDVFTILCSISTAEEFFCDLVGNTVQVLLLKNRKCRYLKRMSLALLLVVSTACENLQQNSAVPFLVQHNEQLWNGLCQAFESVYVIQEEALALTTLLCNHRKHEARNPFVEQIRGASVAQIHACLYALDQHLLYSIHGISKEISTAARNTLLAWTEDTASFIIRNGVEVTSLLGAWIAGTPADVGPTETQAKQQRLKGTSSFQEKSVVPRLSQTSGATLSLPKWIRSRIALLSLYELLCSSGGKIWLDEFLLHETPSWATGGSEVFDSPDMKHPIACPNIFARTLTLVSFGMNSEAPYAALLSLNILRCLAENELACRLFYAVSLENEKDVVTTKVFERRPDVGLFTRNMQDSLYTHALGKSLRPGDQPRFAIICVALRLTCTLLLNTCQDVGSASKAGQIVTKTVAIVQRFLVFQARMQHQMNLAVIGIDWEALWQTLFVVLERIVTTGFKDLNDAEELTLHKMLVTVFNLGVHKKQEQRVLLYYVVVRNRSLLEDWRQYLVNSRQRAAVVQRLIQREMQNLRAIVGHFSSLTGAEYLQEDGMNKEKRAAMLQSILEKEETLKLRSFDPLGATFEAFCEGSTDIFVLKAFTRHLIADMKEHRRFIRHVRV